MNANNLLHTPNTKVGQAAATMADGKLSTPLADISTPNNNNNNNATTGMGSATTSSGSGIGTGAGAASNVTPPPGSSSQSSAQPTQQQQTANTLTYAAVTLPIYDRREIAKRFLTLSSRGQCEESYSYVNMNIFKHHNIHFSGDGYTLKNAMIDNARNFPYKFIEIKKIVQDGDYVTTFSLVTMTDKLRVMVAHMFRFQGNMIVEMWDIGQVLPETIPNENGPF
jgi:predicted SnoaL-like aldol condensation-catalyzing enzyme